MTNGPYRSPDEPVRCGCPSAVYCSDARVAFNPDIYDCVRCGHMNGMHAGPNCECIDVVEVTDER